MQCRYNTAKRLVLLRRIACIGVPVHLIIVTRIEVSDASVPKGFMLWGKEREPA